MLLYTWGRSRNDLGDSVNPPKINITDKYYAFAFKKKEKKINQLKRGKDNIDGRESLLFLTWFLRPPSKYKYITAT